MQTIPIGYLSPEGRAAVKARADELQQYLAQRRAERQITAALGPRRVALRLMPKAPTPRDLSPAFADSVRGDLDVMVPA